MENTKNNSLIHCKQCRAPVVKDVEIKDMEGSILFGIRCPHCGVDCQIHAGANTSSSITILS